MSAALPDFINGIDDRMPHIAAEDAQWEVQVI